MKRHEAQAVIAALVKLRGMATDEQALEVPALYRTWREGEAYEAGERVQHGGVLYKALQSHEAQAHWAPDAAPSLFVKVLIPDADAIPAWEQPDSTNPYMKDDKVEHMGVTWVSDVDYNTWEPGVYGWVAA